MCLAIVQPKGVNLSKTVLAAGFRSNPDGAGFAFVDPDTKKVVINKGYFTFDNFYEKYKEYHDKYGLTSPFLVHFRIRTAGKVDAANCHPFPVAGGAMIHNGHLFWDGSDDSDTNQFASTWGKRLTKEALLLAKDKLTAAVGSNKLAFLYEDGDYIIINENLGKWDGGCWFSNMAHSWHLPGESRRDWHPYGLD